MLFGLGIGVASTLSIWLLGSICFDWVRCAGVMIEKSGGGLVKQVTIFIVVTFFASAAIATEKRPSKSIPFVYDKVTIETIDQGGGAVSTGYDCSNSRATAANRAPVIVTKKVTEKAEVASEALSSVVSSIREAVCKEIKRGSFKVWLSFDASTKILGVGASSEAGIEVSVICDKTDGA